MRISTRRNRQHGAALIVGLILLAIITLLAVVGMNIANGELSSATSEQLRLRAFQAAEGGIEHGLIEMRFVGTTGEAGEGKTFDPVAAAGSPKDADGKALDTYTNSIAYRGDSPVSGYSGKDFMAYHYTIVSEGKSTRNAVSRHETGAYIVGSSGGSANSFGALPEPAEAD
jgi:Tfp pilus assembly protein PilX